MNRIFRRPLGLFILTSLVVTVLVTVTPHAQAQPLEMQLEPAPPTVPQTALQPTPQTAVPEPPIAVPNVPAPQTAAQEPRPPQSCVFVDLGAAEACPLTTQFSAFEILGMGVDSVIFFDYGARARSSSGESLNSIILSSRLEDAILLETIDEDDALLIDQEVHTLSGARYLLPRTRAELMRSFGFPEGAFEARDLADMLRVHLETSLSISASTSRFLLDQMGLAPVVVETHRDTF